MFNIPFYSLAFEIHVYNLFKYIYFFTHFLKLIL